jgi:hypothetical protein
LIDQEDLLTVLGNMGHAGQYAMGDVNHDGVINLADDNLILDALVDRSPIRVVKFQTARASAALEAILPLRTGGGQDTAYLVMNAPMLASLANSILYW